MRGVKKSARRVLLHLGLRIVEQRTLSRLTQEQLAELVGLTRRQISRIEGGKINLSVEALHELSQALRVEIADLFSAPAPSTSRRVGRPAKKGE
jgi:DNA adenine methylase